MKKNKKTKNTNVQEEFEKNQTIVPQNLKNFVGYHVAFNAKTNQISKAESFQELFDAIDKQTPKDERKFLYIDYVSSKCKSTFFNYEK